MLRKKLEGFLVINFHGIVVGALVLVIMGVTGQEGKDPKPVDLTLRKAGLMIVVACWFVLVAWAATSFLRAQSDMEVPAYTEGTWLLYAVSLALPFVGCRELYAVLSTFLTSPTFANSLAIKVCLSVVPEVIAMVLFTAGGLSTLQIAQKIRTTGKKGGKPYGPIVMEQY